MCLGARLEKMTSLTPRVEKRLVVLFGEVAQPTRSVGTKHVDVGVDSAIGLGNAMTCYFTVKCVANRMPRMYPKATNLKGF